MSIFARLVVASHPVAGRVLLSATGLTPQRELTRVVVKGFVYDGPRIVAELDAAGNVKSRFVYATVGHSPDLMLSGGNTYGQSTSAPTINPRKSREMNVDHEWRMATAFEEAVIRKMLDGDESTRLFSAQLDEAKVATIDEYGSLSISPANATPDRALGRMVKLPSEARAPDDDGIDVHFLLFEQGGWLSELQIYKDDGSPIRRRFLPHELDVLVLR